MSIYNKIVPVTLYSYCIGLLFCVFALPAYAQEEKKSQIIILENEYVEYLTKDTISIQRLVKNVKLLHDSDTIYCDSAILYRQLNIAEAYGDVLIKQLDGTEAIADFMRYTGNNKTVYMKGNVQLRDAKGNEMWGNDVSYNLNTKMGTYSNYGTLVSDQTMVSSKHASYNMRSKDARFKENVIVNDPEYHVVSRDLGYNTETKVATFYGPSIVTNENSMLQTRSGYYQSNDKTSKFWSRTSILNDGQYIEADTIFYTKSTGWAQAFGNVIMIDTSRNNSTIYSEYTQYNELSKEMLAYNQPVVKYITEKDVYYYRADTFYSAPLPKDTVFMSAQDSIVQSIEELRQAIDLKNNKINDDGVVKDFDIAELLNLNQENTSDSILFNPIKIDTLPEFTLKVAPNELEGRHRNRKNTEALQEALSTSKKDTLLSADINKPQFIFQDSLNFSNETYYDFPTQDNSQDTSTLRYFKGYYNVKIYADSLQGKCDSMYYNQKDSTITMYLEPILWSGKNQMKGDVIIMTVDSSTLRKITIPKNGIVIGQSGPEQSGFYDQIQGHLIEGYLTDGKIDSLTATNSAMNIYYMKDENDYYSGVNDSKSDKIEVFFKNEEIDKIYYKGPTNGITYPMTEIDPESLRLPRFFWNINDRQTSLEQFLDGKKLNAPQLFRWKNESIKSE
jgi:lipopolysaccharide export system protein LptA